MIEQVRGDLSASARKCKHQRSAHTDAVAGAENTEQEHAVEVDRRRGHEKRSQMQRLQTGDGGIGLPKSRANRCKRPS
jgi:hypothetical protein